jgi:hypothetical protein
MNPVKQQIVEHVMRGVSASMHIDFGTNAPMSISEVSFKKIGFGDIPVACIVITTPGSTKSMVMIARQWVYRELETCGVSNEVVEFAPTVNNNGRRVKFIDANQRSESHGKYKMGSVMRFHFEIKKESLYLFEFKDGKGNIKLGGVKA